MSQGSPGISMRVQKIIANRGYCSRRKAEDLIMQSRVRVNGKTTMIGDSAKDTDTVTVDGREIEKKDIEYLILNKPKGYVTSLKDPYDRTITELLPGEDRLFPVGRLDKDAEGLLLLTNNGDIANKVMHPSYEMEKTYVAETYDEVPKEIIDLINKFGVVISDGHIDVRIRRIVSRVYEVKIHVGYHKVVKKIFDRFDLRVRNLKRIQIGPLTLGKLKSKQWRYLDGEESAEFENYVSLLPKKRLNFAELKEKTKLFERQATIVEKDISKILNKIRLRRANYDETHGIRRTSRVYAIRETEFRP